MTSDRAHWESAYAERTPEKVSWFEPRPKRSLELISTLEELTDWTLWADKTLSF